jgi:hypothetical protein
MMRRNDGMDPTMEVQQSVVCGGLFLLIIDRDNNGKITNESFVQQSIAQRCIACYFMMYNVIISSVPFAANDSTSNLVAVIIFSNVEISRE